MECGSILMGKWPDDLSPGRSHHCATGGLSLPGGRESAANYPVIETGSWEISVSTCRADPFVSYIAVFMFYVPKYRAARKHFTETELIVFFLRKTHLSNFHLNCNFILQIGTIRCNSKHHISTRVIKRFISSKTNKA